MTILTSSTVTDADIRGLLESLPRDHYARQWCVDAMGPPSVDHPHRKPNARARCAELINNRAVL